MPVTVAGQPILLVRNQAGTIAAFHNVCRHRCLMLVDAPKNVGKLIRCPYHAWAYDLDGNLRASPHFGGTGKQDAEGFDKGSSGLVEVRSFVWHDWIFVNLSGDAAKFSDYAAPLIAQLEGLDFDKVQPIGVLDFGVIETNWKLIMENFIEPYHVQFVHAVTTEQPLEDHYTIKDGKCLGSAVDLQEEGGTSGSLGVSSRYLTLYPNFIIGRYFPDQLGVYLNTPLGPGRMAQRRVIYTTGDQTPTANEIEALKKLWWNVHKEDHEMVERLYQGRASSAAADGGVAYKERLPLGSMAASLWADKEHVFLMDENGKTLVLATGPEMEIVATNEIDDLFWSTPAVAGNSLLLRGAKKLYCIREQN